MLKEPITSPPYVYPTPIGNLIVRLKTVWQFLYYFEVYGEELVTFENQKYVVQGILVYRPDTKNWRFVNYEDDIQAECYEEIYDNDFHIFPVGKWRNDYEYGELSRIILNLMVKWEKENPEVFRCIRATENFK